MNIHQLARCCLQIGLWTAGIVLLTLLINAPLIRPCLSWLGLDHVPSTQANIRAKAIQALLTYSDRAIHDLQRDDHEMLRGELRKARSHNAFTRDY